MERTEPIKKLFYTIGEVSAITGVKESALRYWETEFKEIKPVKGPNGRRHYREKDIETIKLIKHLLKEENMRIKGVKRRLSEMRKKQQLKEKIDEINTVLPTGLEDIKKELREVLEILRS